jgi:hypothetical protein
MSVTSFEAQVYKTDVEFSGFSLTTFLNYRNEDGKFSLTSPKNGDKRAIGGGMKIVRKVA